MCEGERNSQLKALVRPTEDVVCPKCRYFMFVELSDKNQQIVTCQQDSCELFQKKYIVANPRTVNLLAIGE